MASRLTIRHSIAGCSNMSRYDKHPCICKRVDPVGANETSTGRVKGVSRILYRAVDKAGGTVDFLLTAGRDRQTALRFLRKAIRNNATPKEIAIDKSGANTAAIESHNTEHKAGLEIRQVKYLNNIAGTGSSWPPGDWCD